MRRHCSFNLAHLPSSLGTWPSLCHPCLPRGSCIWPLLTHSLQYIWGALVADAFICSDAEGGWIRWDHEQGNNFCASPTCCSKPTITVCCCFPPSQWMGRAAHQAHKWFVGLKICGMLCPLHRHGSLICFGRDMLHFSGGGDRLWGCDLAYLNSFWK